jgi:hypothetical protein
MRKPSKLSVLIAASMALIALVLAAPEAVEVPSSSTRLGFSNPGGGFVPPTRMNPGTGGGDITDVVAGNGLTGGAATGAATVHVGAGLGILSNANDVAIDPTYTQRRVGGTCGAGNAIRDIAQDGTVTCETTSSFSTNNVIPKGNGTTLVASSLTDDGTNIQTAASMYVGISTGSATVKTMNVGRNTALSSSGENGWSTQAYSDGNVYVDHKTITSGTVNYRGGHGAETGAAKTFFQAKPSNGDVVFPFNVGIGVGAGSSPSTRLHVRGTGGTSGLTPPAGTVATIENTASDSYLSFVNNSNNQGITFSSSSTAQDGRIIYGVSTRDMNLYAGGQLRADYTDTGAHTIYGESGVVALTVRHNDSSPSGITPVSGTALVVDSTVTPHTGLAIQSTGHKKIVFGNATAADDGQIEYDAVGRDMRFRTAATVALSLSSSQGATFSGTLTATAGAVTVGDFRGTVIAPAGVSGIQHNFAPTGISTATVINIVPAGGIDLTGITTGAEGRELTIRNEGGPGYNIVLYHENVSSSAANRLDLIADTAWTLRTGDSVTFKYTSSRWVMTGHAGRTYPGLFLGANLDLTGVASITNAVDGTFSGNLTAGDTGADTHTVNGSMTITNGLNVSSSGITVTGSGLNVQGGTAQFDQNVVVGNANTDTLTINSKIDSHVYYTGTAPALSSCGTGATINGNDRVGTVTGGTGSPTGCTLTFASAYSTNAPVCVITPLADPGTSRIWISAVSTTVLTISFNVAANSFPWTYHCSGRL